MADAEEYDWHMLNPWTCLCSAALRAGLVLGFGLAVSGVGASSGWLDRVWQADDGLPDNGVTGIAQTADGYLWVGTQGGLVRFDGTRFRELPLVNLARIQSVSVRALAVDRTGRLWLAMDRGSVVCVESNAVRVFARGEGAPDLVTSAMVEDAEGAIWIGYVVGGAGRIKDGVQKYFNARDGLPENGLCDLTSDAKGQIWFAKDRFVGVFRAGRFRALMELKDRAIRICAARSGGTWVATEQRLLKCDEGREPEERAPLASGQTSLEPRVLLADHTGAVWIGTATGGLLRYDGSAMEHLHTSHAEITCLTEDREGNVWAGTGGGGLNRLRPRTIELLGAAAGLPFESVRSVCEDTEGLVWVTTQNGLVAHQQGAAWVTVSAATNWPGGQATCVAADREDGVWIGTGNSGLHRFQNGRFTTWRRQDGLASDAVRSLLTGSNGDLWIGTYAPNRLHRLRDGKILCLDAPRDTHGIRGMAQDASGTIWLGTSWGQLLRVDGDHVVEDPAAKLTPPPSIRCLQTTADGSLWIGYAGAGLGWLKGGRYARITAAQGLFDDHVSQIVADDEGRLWFASNHGLFQTPLKELVDVVEGRAARVCSTEYGRGEGLPSLQASFDYFPGAARGRGGRLWFPMRTGLAVVHTGNIPASPAAPTVLVERVLIDGRPVAVFDPRFAGAQNAGRVADLRAPGVDLRLRPDHLKVEFEFTALSFVAPESIHFRYRLKGLDEAWTEASGLRTASYSRLAAGLYRFQVSARNDAGPWNEAGASLSLKVAPFFWQAWWFRAAALVGFAGLVGVSVRYWSHRRVKRKLERLEQQQALERERARIARDLHDDLGASLTQVGLMLEEVRERPLSAEELRAHSENLVSRVRTLARDLDAVVWTVNPRNDSLHELVAYLSQFFLECFRLTPIRPRLEVADEFPDQPISPEARHHLFLAAKEAINNVIKHSGATEVRLTMAAVDGVFEVKLADNGRGFAVGPAAASNRQGLRNLRARIEELGAKLTILSEVGGGTSVAIAIPLAANRKLQPIGPLKD
jgi:signal transduction histidine kinase/ligand-binding sensor domain-containing protein